MANPMQLDNGSPQAAASGGQLDAYRNLLSPDVAAEDTGLFYQLNTSAQGAAATKAEATNDRYPIEAGGQYA